MSVEKKIFLVDFFSFDFCVDLQVEREDQGDLGMAGARLLPLRAVVCTDS